MTYRVFLSSASDVKPERDAVTRAVARLNSDLPRGEGLELVRWEEDYYTAGSTFQDQIARSSDCDIVVCIFWKRRGSDLPDAFRRPDGTLPSGTEYEFELALEHARASPGKTPDVLAYRKRKAVLYSEQDVEVEREQRERVLAYWNRWFRNEAGHFVAAYHNFDDTPDFEPLVERHLRKWLADRAGTVRWTHGSPFRGLAPFEMEHAEIFFGRRRETERVRARFLAGALAGRRFLLVQGPSGSGKSSLVRAGLLPRLIHSGGIGELPALDRYAIVAPEELRLAGGGDWAVGLASALFSGTALAAELAAGDFPDPAALGAHLARGGEAAAAPVARALARASGEAPQGCVLVLDQFEQVFGWPGGEAAAFCCAVEALTAQAPVFVVATMRSEFQHRLAEFDALARLTSLHEVLGPDAPLSVIDIGTPGAADLREMIEGPAAAAGLVYEGAAGDLPDLARRIEGDAGPEALPALQFLLSELYERREGSRLTHAAYDALGGVTGVMARRGAEVLAGSPADERAAFPNLVRALIRADAAGGPVVARRLPLGFFGAGTAEARLASRLRDAGLLIADESGMRLAHETLIARWDELGEVVRAEKGLFEIRGRLVPLCRKWLEVRQADPGAAPGALLQGLLLAEGREILRAWGPDLLRDPLPELPDYVAASVAADRHRRTLRLGAGVAAALAVVGVGLVVGWLALERREEARIAELQANVARAEAALRGGRLDEALGAVRAATAISATPQTRSLAMTVALAHSSPHLVEHHTGQAASVRFLSDGDVAVLGRDGRLSFGAREVVLPPIAGPGGGYVDFAPLPHGGAVVVASNGRIGIVAAESGALNWLTQRTFFPSSPGQVAIRTSERGFAVAVGDLGQAPGILLDCSGDGACTEADLRPAITALAFASGGDRLAVGSRDGFAIVAIDDPGATVADWGTGGKPVTSVAWVGDETVAVAGRDGVSYLRPGGEGAAAPAPDGPVLVLAGSPDGTRLAVPCRGGALCIDDLAAGTPAWDEVLYRLPAPAVRVAWSPDGSRLATVHADGSWRLWQLYPEAPAMRRIPVSEHALAALDVASDGRLAAGAGAQVHLLDADGRPLRRLPVVGGEVVHVAFAEDGTLGVAAREGGLLRVGPGAGDEPEVTAVEARPERVAWLDDGSLAVAAARRLLVWPADGPPRDAGVDLPSATATVGAAVGGPGGGVVYSRDDGGLLRLDDGASSEVVPLAGSADRLSALSLDLSFDGRWLAASRADDEVRVFDLSGELGPVRLRLQADDSKTVAFAPDGRQLAALGSDGMLYVWRFDAADGVAEPVLTIDPVPFFLSRTGDGQQRQAAWIAWTDPTHIAVATARGDILVLSMEWEATRARLDALAEAIPTPE